jgi:two-component system response regulator AtoC
MADLHAKPLQENLTPAVPTSSGSEPLAQRASFGTVEDLLGRVADTDVTVLIRGERGTGKELAARAIHGASRRRHQPFVKINCAAAPHVLETELFGWDRAAIAGGGQHRPGRLEFANYGTLFLDQVCALAMPLQLRLARALREHEFARLGAGDRVHVEGRVLASSERDLERGVAEGTFHEELFFLLNVVCLTLPPLRQRRSEMRDLAQFFVRRYASHYNRPIALLSADTLRAFVEYPWPGNVQELASVVQRMVMLDDETGVCKELRRGMTHVAPPRPPVDAPRPPPAPPPPSGIGSDPSTPTDGPISLKDIGRQAAEDAERELILRTLQQTRWNRREAAAMLGVSYKALLYKIKRAELDGAS